MSLTYAEIYKNKIKNRNNINNEENNSKNQKIISLIKKFPAKQRKTFKNEKNFKPRRIQSKSVQMIQKYRKTNEKKKKISKQKMEKKEKNNEVNTNKAINQFNKKKKKDINIDDFEINKFYKTKINNKNNNKKDDIKKQYYKEQSKTIDNNNEIQPPNDDFKELEDFNKVNKFDIINKSKNNSINTYFDIFRLRQHSANFKDKVKNNIYLTKYNSNNDLYKLFGLNEKNNYSNKNQKTKSYSEFSQKKSKTYYKAIKLKEQLEYNIKNNNLNKPMYSSCDNFYVKNKQYNKNAMNENNKNNLVIEMNQHFFDEKEKRPKIMRKYLTHNATLNRDKKEDKKNFSTRTFGLCFENNGKNKDENSKNDLISDFRSEIYTTKFKRKVNFNNKSLNLIVQDNPKLNNLLRKIPSSKEKKEKKKSLDLINYIYYIRNKNDKEKYITNIKFNSDINLGIYPVNEWEPIARFKCQNFK